MFQSKGQKLLWCLSFCFLQRPRYTFRIMFFLLSPFLQCPPFHDQLQHLVPPKKVFPGDRVVKNQSTKAGDAGSVSGWGGSPGEGNGNPLQYACLENPMDRGSWRVAVQGLPPCHLCSISLMQVQMKYSLEHLLKRHIDSGSWSSY